MSLAGIMITIMSYVFYNERLNWVHFVGMGAILSALFLMGYFTEDPHTTGIEIEDTHASTGNSTSNILKVLMWGVFASMSFSFEVIWIRWLLNRGVQGLQGGQMAVTFDGLYGVILLIVLTSMGEGMQTVSPIVSLQILTGGALLSGALILVNYSVANGIAGIAFSVANSFPAWHVVFNWLVLGQAITAGQLVGVALAVIGSSILSLQ